MKPRNQIALLKVIWRRCHLLQFLILVNIACFFSFLAYYSTIIRVRTSSMRLKSTCSEQADLRGPNQRIISYSVYGNLSDPYIIQRYLKPMLSNIENIHELYPGWIVRIYHNSTEEVEKLETLFQLDDHVDLCNSTQIIQHLNLGDIFAMTWRWLPLLDDLVDVMISRDSDTYIIDRELAAVQEWMSSNEHTFHVMRDHPYHCIEILGGMWGAKLHRNRTLIRLAIQDMLTSINHTHIRDFDQQLLRKFIWPIAEFDVMEHDSYCCERFYKARPFPTQRKGKEFVGMIGRPAPCWSYNECPAKCRGSHSKWLYC